MALTGGLALALDFVLFSPAARQERRDLDGDGELRRLDGDPRLARIRLHLPAGLFLARSPDRQADRLRPQGDARPDRAARGRRGRADRRASAPDAHADRPGDARGERESALGARRRRRRRRDDPRRLGCSAARSPPRPASCSGCSCRSAPSWASTCCCRCSPPRSSAASAACPGAFAGGLIIGLGEAVTVQLVGAEWRAAVAFLVLIAVLHRHARPACSGGRRDARSRRPIAYASFFLVDRPRQRASSASASTCNGDRPACSMSASPVSSPSAPMPRRS